MRRFAYRCFLPDLTGFTSSHCAGPNLQRCSRWPDPKKDRPQTGFNPAIADCGLQGTATSPFSTAKLGGHNRFWRRGWDLNPRYSFPYTRSPGVLLQPLGHPSAMTANLILLVSPGHLSHTCYANVLGGGGGIRTHEALARLLAFEASSFNRSDTPPDPALRPGRLPSLPLAPFGAPQRRPQAGKHTLALLHRT
jgi:hypothetical protein